MPAILVRLGTFAAMGRSYKCLQADRCSCSLNPSP